MTDNSRVRRSAPIAYETSRLGWIAMRTVVVRYPKGGIDRTPSWRITPEGEALLTQHATRRVAQHTVRNLLARA